MSRILIIDDDDDIVDLLLSVLKNDGYACSLARDGAEGWAAVQREPPDLVLCDVNLPRMDGFKLCMRIREAGYTFPIVLLTARDATIDEALGLELGADDYITKPVRPRVLLARLHALLRRAQEPAEKAKDARLGALKLDAEKIEIHYRDRPLDVTLTEFRLVETLAARPGVVFDRARLMEGMRGDDSVVAERIVDTYVRRLRRKFEAIDPTFDSIETVIGAGYRWKPEKT